MLNCIGVGNEMEDEMSNEKKFEEIEEITLSFEDGNEEACEPLGLLELDGKDYIVLASNKEEEIYFFGYSEKENGEIELDNIEDEKIFEQLSDEFSKVLDEIADEEDEDAEGDHGKHGKQGKHGQHGHQGHSCSCGCGHDHN